MALDEVRDPEERLKSVQAAIKRIEEEGQSVQIQGRTYTQANIRQLYAQERKLERLLSRKERGGIRTRQGVPVDG